MTNHELDTAITKEEAKNRRLRSDLTESNARLKILREARRVLRGEQPTGKKTTIADAIEDVLRKAGTPMHVDDLLKALRKRGGHHSHVAKESITTALWRLVKQKRRFRNVAPNTFALLK
jgi:hypothetical protein